MAASARELVGWSDERWAAVNEAADRALARTAKCRQVVPKGSDQLGDKAVVIPNVVAGPPLAFGPDTVASPIQLFVDVQIDDQHIENEGSVLRLVEAGASQLGVLEDQEVVQGAPAAAAAARVPRNPALMRGRLGRAAGGAAGGPGTTTIGAAGAMPTAGQIMTAIASAAADLENVGRPGPCGLLLHNTLLAVMRVPAVAGAPPLIQQVEQLIGSSEIAGTSALDGSLNPGDVCGILLRLEPAAVDLVHTQKPSVTVLGRAGGQTALRVEEEIVLRVMDQGAIHLIEY